MTVGWRGAEPPALPVPAGAARFRLALRGAAAVVLTVGMFGVFLVARGLDRAAGAMARRRLPALAPWVVHAWGRLALPLAGLAYVAEGRPMAHPGALVANHASWLDVVVLMRATRVFFVSKADVEGWPGIGTIARAIGTIFVERRPAEAKRQQAVLHARLVRGDRMVIFAEGTSSDGQRVLPFKSSLFGVFFAPELHDRLWLQPVSIVYRAPAGLPAAFYGWWGGMEFGDHLLAVLALSRGGVVEVVFHPPLRAADFADRKALTARAEVMVRGAVEARLVAGAARGARGGDAGEAGGCADAT